MSLFINSYNNIRKHKFLKKTKLVLHSLFSKKYSKLKKRDYPHNNKYFPLTKMQEAFYWSSKIKSNSSSYIVNQQAYFAGHLDIDKFERCVQSLVQRHEILRTTFHEVKGVPLQRIEDPFLYKIIYFDLSAQPELDKEIHYKKIHDEYQRKIDITKLPLFQVLVFRMDETNHRIVINIHHLIGDGYTIGLMIYELNKLYINRRLPKLKFQYADYALFEKDNAKSLTSEDIEYWKSYFSGYEPLSLNSMKKKLSDLQSNQATTLRYFIHPSVEKKLTSLKEKLNTSLFMIFLSTFFILLSRHSDVSKIFVGLSKSTRDTLPLMRSLGLYLNSLVITHEFDNNITFTDLIREFEKKRNNLFARSNNHFVDIVKNLKPPHFKNRNRYFDVLFNFIDGTNRLDVNLDDSKYVGFDMHNIETEYLLTMYVVDYFYGTHTLIIKYFNEIFDAKTIQTLCFQYENLLEQVSSNPNKKLSEYSLVYQEKTELDIFKPPIYSLPFYQHEQAKPTPSIIPNIAEKINKIPLQTVPELILEQYKINPLKTAIIKGKKSWSYGEFVDTANVIAGQLKQKGLNKGDVVAIHSDKAFGLYASLLGTWMAGGVILMIDPNSPVDYKQKIIQESNSKLFIQVLSNSSAAVNFQPEIASEFNLTINEENVLSTNSSPESFATLEDSAYIVFTSGTTNTPKGILGTHEGLAHFVSWQRNQFHIDAGDRCVQITNVTFDVVLREICTPLISGATLCIPTASEGLESGHFLEYLDQTGITMMHTVPTLMDFLIEHSPILPEMLHLHWIFFAGEPLQDHLVHKWRAKFPNTKARLVNLYGPSETTLAKAFYELPEILQSGIQPIGKPLPQTKMFILNKTGKQCGVGEMGEICIYTPYKTRGYLNLTSQHTQFIQHAWIDDPQAIIYHSNDLGFLDADGNIHIAGRLDDQLKINGVRINPNHITSVILKNFPIKQCAVIARENEKKEMKLVAYVVPHDHSKAATLKQEIKAYLRSHYASYYVPSAIIFIDQIPYTTRGKIDKKSLPAVYFEENNENSLPNGEPTEFNEIELLLKDFCESTLLVKVKNNQTNLFENGLDSLASLELIMHINQTYHSNIDFHELRELETLHKISNRITNGKLKAVNSSKGMTIENLKQYVSLPDSFSTDYNKIFITGATGFLGSYLLNELIQTHPDVKIYCLIRAENNEKALKKIIYTFTKYKHSILNLENHIIPVLGDLSQPLLGLHHEEFDRLSKEIDLIYHCGATVHFASNFKQLYNINVEGTKTILHFARTHKVKALHYISTAGIYPINSETSSKIIHDDRPFEPHEVLNTGYTQTKWIADQMVNHARRHHIPVTIYRPGEISGDTKTGAWKEDLIFRFIEGCGRLEALPNLPTTLDLTPVNLLARAIIAISFNREHLGKNFNIVNPNQVSVEQLDSSMKHLGLNTKILPYTDWREKLMEIFNTGQKNSLLSLIEFFPPSYEDFPRLKFNRSFTNQNILNAVENPDEIFPNPFPKLLNLYMETIFGGVHV